MRERGSSERSRAEKLENIFYTDLRKRAHARKTIMRGMESRCWRRRRRRRRPCAHFYSHTRRRIESINNIFYTWRWIYAIKIHIHQLPYNVCIDDVDDEDVVSVHRQHRRPTPPPPPSPPRYTIYLHIFHRSHYILTLCALCTVNVPASSVPSFFSFQRIFFFLFIFISTSLSRPYALP